MKIRASRSHAPAGRTARHNDAMSDRRGLSVAVIAAGVVLAIGAAVSYAQVSSALRDQGLIVPDGACLAGETVAGPFTAFCASRSAAFPLDAPIGAYSLSALAFVAGAVIILVGAAGLHRAERAEDGG